MILAKKKLKLTFWGKKMEEKPISKNKAIPAAYSLENPWN